jgi:cellulose synthase/poly-beta-1,6-N-acetylglucosamine synthase-like glycosyltransferase
MVHAYIVYPVLMNWLARNKKLETVEVKEDGLPHLAIVLSVYNGERLINKKIKSIFDSSYPPEKIHAFVGSDGSADGTNELLKQLSSVYPNLHIFTYNRQGKIETINRLHEEVLNAGLSASVTIMTDVSAIFDPFCFKHLIQALYVNEVAVVGAYITKGNHRVDGISFQEKTYYEGELTIKYSEGVLWGVSMGAFGACYAIRTSDVQPVPSNFLVDDFFMTMALLQSGKKAVYSKEASVFMDIPNESSVEFKRKARIAAGNFQNFFYFLPVVYQFNALSFAYWSHKVIRWFGPFFILAAFVCSYNLLSHHSIYQIAFMVQCVLLITPLLNYLLEKVKIHLKLLKFVAHFYLMNLGILTGFFKFTKGINTNVWTPTQR